MCLQSVYNPFTTRLQCVYNVFTMCLQCVYRVSTMRLECVYRVSTMCLQYVYNAFTMCLQCVYNAMTMCSQCVHNVFTMCSQCVHNVFTMCSQCVHNVFTMCSQCVHNAFTMCSQCVHNVLTMCSQCVQVCVWVCVCARVSIQNEIFSTVEPTWIATESTEQVKLEVQRRKTPARDARHVGLIAGFMIFFLVMFVLASRLAMAQRMGLFRLVAPLFLILSAVEYVGPSITKGGGEVRQPTCGQAKLLK